ncbi:MAG: hypothetical protein AB7S44_02055 [Spirochaetales bacterium]
MIKKFSAILILIFSVFSLAGCADAFYQVNVYDNGSILEGFYVELDEAQIVAAGYTYGDVLTEVESSFQTVRSNLVNAFINRDDGLTIFEKNVIMQGIRNYVVSDNIVSISFLFDSYTNYRYFYGQLEEPEPDPENTIVEDKIFYIKTTTISHTAFNNVGSSSLTASLLDYFSDPANGTETFDLSDVNFTYSYATASTKIRSNADRVYYSSNGLKVHEWSVPSDNLDMQIEFYEYQIVPLWWYVGALVLTGVFIAFLFVKYKAQNYIENKKNNIQEVAEFKVIEDNNDGELKND